MGLTVHYTLSADCTAPAQAKKLLARLRQCALDLPVETVSEIRRPCGTAPRWDDGQEHDPLWLDCIGIVRRGAWVCDLLPRDALAFRVRPGPGCEDASFGLCRFPASMTIRGKRIRTGYQGWTWYSFCKTQYASNPTCGGMRNFLRCHLSLIRLLDEAVRLGFKVDVCDEGGFWQSRDLAALCREVGQWNEMIAGLAGEFKDLLGDQFASAISSFPNFEHLEARGRALRATRLRR